MVYVQPTEYLVIRQVQAAGRLWISGRPDVFLTFARVRVIFPIHREILSKLENNGGQKKGGSLPRQDFLTGGKIRPEQSGQVLDHPP